MKKILIITTIFLFGTNALQAQTIDLRPYIEVNGTAELKIVPNQIFIAITLEENLDREKKTIAKQESELIAALKAVGISQDKLVLNDASSFYGKRKRISKEVISRKSYELKVATAKESSAAFDAMDKLNIKNAYISKVWHTEMDKYKKEVKVLAMQAAKDKASYLLEAVDEQLGMPIVIRETNSNNYRRNTNFYANVAYEANDSKQEYEVDQFKKITLSSTVYTKWLIKE